MGEQEGRAAALVVSSEEKLAAATAAHDAARQEAFRLPVVQWNRPVTHPS